MYAQLVWPLTDDGLDSSNIPYSAYPPAYYTLYNMFRMAAHSIYELANFLCRLPCKPMDFGGHFLSWDRGAVGSHPDAVQPFSFSLRTWFEPWSWKIHEFWENSLWKLRTRLEQNMFGNSCSPHEICHPDGYPWWIGNPPCRPSRCLEESWFLLSCVCLVRMRN